MTVRASINRIMPGVTAISEAHGTGQTKNGTDTAGSINVADIQRPILRPVTGSIRNLLWRSVMVYELTVPVCKTENQPCSSAPSRLINTFVK